MFLSSQLSENKATQFEFKASLGYKAKPSLNKTKPVNRAEARDIQEILHGHSGLSSGQQLDLHELELML